MANDKEQVKIKASVYWAFTNKTDQFGNYSIVLGDLSPAAVKALESLELEVLSKEGQGFYISCKSQHPIKAYDTDKDEIKGVLVGNGSKCIALIGTYNWQFKKKSGKSPSLKSLVITDLIEYEPESIVDDDEEAL